MLTLKLVFNFSHLIHRRRKGAGSYMRKKKRGSWADRKAAILNGIMEKEGEQGLGR